mmetsp:Transcript_26566/g.56623  ORF Transcript_26566/g.56623 Transcript_26566/m.56623 type:complete len:123 (+) Transcript_26566:37-405(+)
MMIWKLTFSFSLRFVLPPSLSLSCVQLKRLKALVSTAAEDMSSSQADRLAASIAGLEQELPDLVNSVRALAIDVSTFSRSEQLHPDFYHRVEAQERATSRWEEEVHQVIEGIRSASAAPLSF